MHLLFSSSGITFVTTTNPWQSRKRLCKEFFSWGYSYFRFDVLEDEIAYLAPSASSKSKRPPRSAKLQAVSKLEVSYSATRSEVGENPFEDACWFAESILFSEVSKE